MDHTELRQAARRWHKRHITWPVAGSAAWLGLRLTKLLPIDSASAIFGGLARKIGPVLGVSARARQNLRFCFPDWSEGQIEATVSEMWDNFGRVAGEFAHLRHLDLDGSDPRIDIVGREHVDAMTAAGGPGLFFSAHIGNWEVLPLINNPMHLDLHVIYRRMNAPIAERALRQAAGPESGTLIPKGPGGAMRLARAMRNGSHVAMMVDQKLNEGIDVPFFGRPAKTSPAIAALALRHRCPLLPIHTVRLGGARFRIIIEPPLALPASGNTDTDVHSLMTTINHTVEGWIRDNPGQWFWLHRRWER